MQEMLFPLGLIERPEIRPCLESFALRWAKQPASVLVNALLIANGHLFADRDLAVRRPFESWALQPVHLDAIADRPGTVQRVQVQIVNAIERQTLHRPFREIRLLNFSKHL